jgi:FKBP-type peptidyl-prolyl cis-trans isomerase SlyD
MTDADATIAENMVITLDYTLTLDSGEIADTTQDRMPLRFLAGHGALLPAFEDALIGLAAGEERAITLAPIDAYGEFDPDAFEEVPLDAFPSDGKLQVGTVIGVHDADGDVYEAYVNEVRKDSVLLDYNHPLAGETLHFRVTVLDVRPATPEELEHGHAHGDDHGHGHDGHGHDGHGHDYEDDENDPEDEE